MSVMATVRVIVEHKSDQTFVPFLCVRHGSDVKADQLDKDLTEYEVRPVQADQLDKDLTEYEVRPVRLVNLCTDKKHTASDC